MDRQRASKDVANLLCYEAVEPRINAGEKPRFLQLRLSPLHLLIYLAHDVLRSGHRGVPNPHEEFFDGKFQRIKLLLDLGRVEQIYEGKHHTTVNVGVAQVCRKIVGKAEKGI